VGIVANGNGYPFVMDAEGRVYCRRHGGALEPSYPALLEAYRRQRLAQRRMEPRRREAELAPLGILLQRIEARYHPEEVWLFGSRARGDARPTSDWDLLVVVSDSMDEDELDLMDAWRLQRDSGVHADVIPVRASDYRALVDTPNTLAYEVAREGFVIHERQ
jgi:uncharacterized protein